jgi:hypothetical protein
MSTGRRGFLRLSLVAVACTLSRKVGGQQNGGNLGRLRRFCVDQGEQVTAARLNETWSH